MAQITKSNGSLTVYSLRRAVGIKARRPSRFNACIGAALRGKSYSKPGAGQGGRHNQQVHAAFSSAVNGCK